MNISASNNRDPDSNSHQLARVQVPKFTSPIQNSNPSLAAHMLQEMYNIVRQWQGELEQIEQSIQTVTASGPTLAAWLESRDFKPGITGKAIPTPYATVDVVNLTTVDARADYRLCGLDEHGKLWTRPCLLSEISSVSMAIARYQQLKVLLDRRQKIELSIGQIIEDLVYLRLKLED
jgi:hypothetical protein